MVVMATRWVMVTHIVVDINEGGIDVVGSIYTLYRRKVYPVIVILMRGLDVGVGHFGMLEHSNAHMGICCRTCSCSCYREEQLPLLGAGIRGWTGTLCQTSYLCPDA